MTAGCTHPRTWIGDPAFIARSVPGSGQQWSICQSCGYAWLVQVWKAGAEPEADRDTPQRTYRRDYSHAGSRHGGAEGSSIKGEKL